MHLYNYIYFTFSFNAATVLGLMLETCFDSFTHSRLLPFIHLIIWRYQFIVSWISATDPPTKSISPNRYCLTTPGKLCPRSHVVSNIFQGQACIIVILHRHILYYICQAQTQNMTDHNYLERDNEQKLKQLLFLFQIQTIQKIQIGPSKITKRVS